MSEIHHSGLGLNSPSDVHYGLADVYAIERAAPLDAARVRFPERFSAKQAPQRTLAKTAWLNTPVLEPPGNDAFMS